MKYIFMISVLACLFIVPAAWAGELYNKYEAQINDDAAKAFLLDSLQHVEFNDCEENGEACKPIQPEELTNFPITIIEARAAMAHGGLGTLAQLCGLDHKRVFLPMIAYGKYHEKMSDRNLMIMSDLYGRFMGRQLITFKKMDFTCPEHLKTQLDQELATMPAEK